MKSVEGGAGAGDGAWEKLAGCREAGAATGIGGANGRAEDCPGVDGGTGRRCYGGDGGLSRIGVSNRGGPLFG